MARWQGFLYLIGTRRERGGVGGRGLWAGAGARGCPVSAGGRWGSHGPPQPAGRRFFQIF